MVYQKMNCINNSTTINMEKVVLVNLDDQVIGQEEKMIAHEKGLLHRAFSVFLFNDNQVLIHKRASTKYHCGGLWTNTCCSHPRLNEEIIDAAKRRLNEELGIVINELKEVNQFVYHYPFSNGLCEYEVDHIVIGEYNGDWILNPEEVDEIKWIDIQELKEDILKYPNKYTPWFITALNQAIQGR